ncbi:MAG: hypothetical protein DRQ88_05870 [Epsilonproteobacteria bacterium]|nr:MAG: hypothetical protein DRQ88_05870 [Campylobacterota bacterium]
MSLKDLLAQEDGYTQEQLKNFKPTQREGATFAKLPTKGEEKKFRFLYLPKGGLSHTTYTHWGVKNEKGYAVKCIESGCPICELAKQHPDRELKATKRYSFLVLDLSSDDPWSPAILGIPPTAGEDLMAMWSEDDMINPFHPVEGCAVKFKRESNNGLSLMQMKPGPLADSEEKIMTVMERRPDVVRIQEIKDYHITSANTAAKEVRANLDRHAQTTKATFEKPVSSNDSWGDWGGGGGAVPKSEIPF